MANEHTLIATLGGKPQVVTLVFDLLKARSYNISRLVIIHTVGIRVQAAISRLKQELSGQVIDVAFLPIKGEDGATVDIATEDDMSALLRILYRAVLEEKRKGRTVHLSVAGGRKTMAIQGMVVAQLLFDEQDRVWHLLSEDRLINDEKIMHPRPGDHIQLVPVPVLRWSTVSPMLTELALREDPWEALKVQRSIQRAEDHRRKQEFIGHKLTRAEREVMRLVCYGLDNATIADRLRKSEKTVANQLTEIYEEFHQWRGFRSDVPVSRSVLIAEFAGYFAGSE